MDEPHREFEQSDQRGEHLAQLHFAGCPNCGYAVDVTVAALRHGDALLGLIYHLLGTATDEEMKSAIALLRGTYDERVTWQLLDDADFFELKELWEATLNRPERARDTKRRRPKK